MFEGVQDQLHQFIASSRTSLPIPLTFPLHGNSNTTFPTFYHHSSNQQSHLLPPLHHPSPPTHKDHHERDRQEPENNHHHHHHNNNNTNLLISTNLVLERERSGSEPMDPWSNDEVLALLRIRSSLENWFPNFTWEHVSRKLAEVGFVKRSAEKCKEKFEEESRYFNFTNINNTFNNHTTTTTTTTTNNNNNNKQNYRFFSELEELCHGESSTDNNNNNNNNNNIDHHHIVEKTIVEETPNEEEEEKEEEQQDKNHNQVEEEKVSKINKSKKRKRRERHENKFEMLKCFCEGVVKKIMGQQEELHNKLIEDMVKRDEEIIAKEEAWKKEEMSRIEKEIEIRANEQAIVGDRQATIFELLKKFNFEDFQDKQHCFLNFKVPQNPNLETQNNQKIPTSLDEALAPQNPNSTFPPNISIIPNSSNLAIDAQNPNSLKVPNSSTLALDAQNSNSLNTQIVSRLPNSSTLALDAQNPNSPNTQNDPSSSKRISNSTHETPQKHSFVAPPAPPNNEEDQDHHHGKIRWPRDEVLALINLRCNFYNNNNGEDNKEGSTTTTTTTTTSNKSAPLWERISQGMFGLGYKRSAKRCKEKWENINKYFRKTKDNVNKKRSFNSRTCPYYHQLSNLYKQGTLVAPPQPPPPPPPPPSTISENRSSSRVNHPNSPENRPTEFSQVVSTSNTNNMHGGGCDDQKSMIQAPTFDFEF